MKELIFIISVLVSLSTYADPLTVPNTFNSGTPARASEVNANFGAVVSSVNNLDGRLKAIESQLPTPQILTFVKNELPVGSVVSIDGIDYVIAQIEVPQISSDNIMLIKFPTSASAVISGVDAGFAVYGYGEYAPVTASSECEYASLQAVIDGYKTKISFGYSFMDSISISSSNSTTFSKNFTSYYQLGICLDNTTIVYLRDDAFNNGPGYSSSVQVVGRSVNGENLLSTYPVSMDTFAKREAMRTKALHLLPYVSVRPKTKMGQLVD